VIVGRKRLRACDEVVCTLLGSDDALRIGPTVVQRIRSRNIESVLNVVPSVGEVKGHLAHLRRKFLLDIGVVEISSVPVDEATFDPARRIEMLQD
jgi:hypothetical protein